MIQFKMLPRGKYIYFIFELYIITKLDFYKATGKKAIDN
jgi:hypothetical protein